MRGLDRVIGVAVVGGPIGSLFSYKIELRLKNNSFID
jgi:hypothetical protein